MTAVQPTRHMQESQGQIPALASRQKSSDPFKLFPPAPPLRVGGHAEVTRQVALEGYRIAFLGSKICTDTRQNPVTCGTNHRHRKMRFAPPPFLLRAVGHAEVTQRSRGGHAEVTWQVALEGYRAPLENRIKSLEVSSPSVFLWARYPCTQQTLLHIRIIVEHCCGNFR